MLLYYQNLSFIESQYVIVLILLNLKKNPRGGIYVTRVRSEGILYLLHHRGHALRTPMGPWPTNQMSKDWLHINKSLINVSIESVYNNKILQLAGKWKENAVHLPYCSTQLIFVNPWAHICPHFLPLTSKEKKQVYWLMSNKQQEQLICWRARKTSFETIQREF